MSFLKVTAAIVRKDLASELRSGEVFLSMLLFSLLLVLVFSFAFLGGGAAPETAAAGVIWVTSSFAGILGISRVWDREREAGGLAVMLLSPAGRPAVFVAKTAVLFVLLLLCAVFVVPLAGLLFEAPLTVAPARLTILLALGILGQSMLGAFFGALMAKSRSRDLLFSIAIFPLLFPLLIAGVMGSAELFSDQPVRERVDLFTSLLLAYDAMILVISFWTFERAVAD
ncbi:MAG: heme exporter protein CcmB [Myxococcota bacterium]